MMPALSKLSQFGRFMLRPGCLAVLIAFSVMLAAGIFADYQNRLVHRQEARAAVSEQLGKVRARLEASLNSNIQLVRGLVAVIASDPAITQAQFAAIASELMGNRSQLRNVAAAPDLVIRYVHPLQGNEKAIGLDYRKVAGQREAAMRAVRSGSIILAGPVELVQGGQGFVGRFPVFVPDDNGGRRLWGLVSAVIDVQRLYVESGLLDKTLPIRLAIAGRDADAVDRTVFFGDPAIFGEDPVTALVALPGGNWRLAAMPKAGWATAPENEWHLRIALALALMAVTLPIAFAGLFYERGRTHAGEIERGRDTLQRLSNRLKIALNTSQIGVWELDLTERRLTWDDRMRELYWVPDGMGSLSYHHWSQRLHPGDREKAQREFWHAIEVSGEYRSEFRVVDTHGHTRWIRAIGAVYEGVKGNRYIVGVNWDVSRDVELKNRLLAAKQDAELRNRQLEIARTQMEHASMHDSLTGLPNRRYLDERIFAAGTDEIACALLHVDLDRFKQINDTLGHVAGDHMLVHAAAVLAENIRPGDIVARIGGDEFVIVVRSHASEADLTAMAERIIDSMRQPVTHEGHECRIGASIGIAMASGSGETGRNLLIDADIAMYRAKNRGRNRFEFFTSALRAETLHNKSRADQILTGLERGEFVPWFQPQFDARTLDIVGVEALARWDHPTEGILQPASFLDIAGELNVVAMIDRAILSRALFHTTRWRNRGIFIPRLSVNVSSGQLNDPDLCATLRGLSIEPGTVSFELLESIFLDESSETISRNVAMLESMGIDIEIDDFGTGYASIISLINLRPRRLKIDRRLVTPILASAERQRLVASIIDIGRSLGVKVVAEGVETMGHAEILRDLGCDILQGYAFSRPLAPDQLAEFALRQPWRMAA